jgi:phenylpropionate dioxygenase-like ring-hydroxylating dioxygenase large terminal subunit
MDDSVNETHRTQITPAKVFNTQSEFLKEFPLTGPETLGGKLLRRYWHPVCLSKDLQDIPYPVRMLSEELVAFRGIDGKVGLIGDRCAHRCASLQYGQIRAEGLECSYHGWTYDRKGSCVRMPLEPLATPLLAKVKQKWYPTEEWAGIVWTYMGPEKDAPPPLPKVDILARTDGELIVERGDFRNYNYQNFLENFVDMGHVYVLHMLAPGEVPEDVAPYCDKTVDIEWRNITHKSFDTSYGMKSVLVHNTSDPDKKFINTWSFAPPAYWRFGGISAGLPPDFTDDRRESGGMLRIIDDGHFEIIRHTLIRPGNFRSTFFTRGSDKSRGLAEGTAGPRAKKDYDYRKYPAWEGRPPLEDLVIQESQGVIPPREHEMLASSDIGVARLRRMWRSSMEAIAQGREPFKIKVDEDGIFKVDTFKGFAKTSDVKLGSENMPSSEGEKGLIRDKNGKVVFS